MSSEQNLPEVHVHQGPPPAASHDEESSFQAGSSAPHGMGQSKSSRRRRRKRKGKGPELAGGEAQGSESQDGGGEIPAMQAAAAPAPAPSVPQGQSFQAASSPGHQGNGGTSGGPATKRWKKKFRDRERPRFTENPGNNAPRESRDSHSNAAPRENAGHSNGGGGGGASQAGPRDTSTHQFGNRADSFKRKSSNGGGGGGGGKQQYRDRGPRTFVGPMDHSYRAGNSDFNEAPPSTIPTQNFVRRGSNYHSAGDSQPIDYSQGKSVPISDTAPTKIYFFIEDLFFLAKISETARKVGVKVVFVKATDKEAIASLTAAEEEDRPGLIVFDLNNATVKPLTLIPKLKAKLKRSTSIIGFLSHIQGDLKAKAVEAGCDTVMARAAFSQNLPNLLRRYGLEEEEENNFNY